MDRFDFAQGNKVTGSQDDELVGGAVFKKAKGRFLLRDLALSVPIFGDPVLVPDHNACHPGIVRHPRATTRAFTSLFHDHIRCKSFPTAVRFQLPGPSTVADSRRPLLVRSLLLEDYSSAETNSTLQQREY
jgi:hypothetical protein